MTLDWHGALTAVIEHPLFSVGITLGAYQLAQALYAKTKLMIFQPLLVAVMMIVAILLLLGMDYQLYRANTQLLILLLGPATVALAVPLYQNIKRVREVLFPTLITLVVAGTFATVLGVGIAWLLGAEHLVVMALAPKSVTTPIAMLVADEIGGSASLAAVFVMITGMLGAMFGVELLRLFRVVHPAAVGMALGMVAHAIGTARALQEGDEVGAFSALAMSMMGVMTAVALPLVVAMLS
ncbi:MAG: LrgB family protein [Thiopseudomonas sp.]|nr:LrgB family protein [Thiopseudomonas sp.]MCK9466368.1 LrgB family protein [Thiopseudomonas sp.]